MPTHRPRNENNTRIFTISINPELLALIDLEAAIEDVSRSKWISDACKKALESKVKKTKRNII